MKDIARRTGLGLATISSYFNGGNVRKKNRIKIEEAIESKAGKNLESYSLFDIYEGDQIEDGFKSVAYSIVFRAKDRTLEDSDIQSAMNKILKELESMGIELRA